MSFLKNDMYVLPKIAYVINILRCQAIEDLATFFYLPKQIDLHKNMATKQKVVFFILLSLGLIITLVVYFFLQKHDNTKVESAYLEKKHILIEQLKSKNMRLGGYSYFNGSL